MSKGTVARHLLVFQRPHVDKMNQYLYMKGYYLVMVNVPIHISDNRTKYITFQIYSSDFNPVKQFSRKGNIDDTDQ